MLFTNFEIIAHYSFAKFSLFIFKIIQVSLVNILQETAAIILPTTLADFPAYHKSSVTKALVAELRNTINFLFFLLITVAFDHKH